ncbi:MAG: esterase-like activity of phytase family protein [Candidatus Polarisedimenticolaceae bacterium]|nr:esterase-like activity of phytase family protein [Candidatus Polarisedimenticolaceae bacterium]
MPIYRRFKQSAVVVVMAATMMLMSACNHTETDDSIADTGAQYFNRVSSFPVYLNGDIGNETVAEIVAAANSGNMLIYTDGKMGKIGFVDITDITAPTAAGSVVVGGEPTSVTVVGNYALAAVNTSLDFINTSGNLVVIDITTKTIIETIPLAGQPDAISVSPDGQYAAIAIENERDEALGDGAPPQAPAGLLQIIDLTGTPANWQVRDVSLSGLADLYADDPETEFVDINDNNIAVITLQENNHIVLVDLSDGSIVNHFSAGSVNLSNIDITKDSLITQTDNLTDLLREPDGISWLGNDRFATANEGDLNGGSRGFTLFNIDGSVAYESAESVEHIITSRGHFPDKRAAKKGNEPENVEYGVYGDEEYLFVGSERSSVVLVYRITADFDPEFIQLLPAATKPEGLLAIPERGLFIAAGEEDSRADKIRSALTIYQLQDGTAHYPNIVSNNDLGDLPVGWGALSALSIDQQSDNLAYTVADSFYDSSRIFVVNIAEAPARINREILLKDTNGQLTAVDANLVNGDAEMSVNLDPEGIATSANGGFWLASEGKGTIGDLLKPFEFENMLLHISSDGLIKEVVTLPTEVADRQVRYGFEGVAAVMDGTTEMLYVVFQRSWRGDNDNRVRIGQYNTDTAKWRFFHYELDAVESINGGWVGLSDITSLGNDRFMVIERDNQGGPDAAIKRLYKFSIAGVTPLADDGSDTVAYPVLTKTLVDDLMDNLAATGGLTLEKIEGLAVTADGTVLIINDNDGVDDSNGETQLLRLPNLL